VCLCHMMPLVSLYLLVAKLSWITQSQIHLTIAKSWYRQYCVSLSYDAFSVFFNRAKLFALPNSEIHLTITLSWYHLYCGPLPYDARCVFSLFFKDVKLEKSSTEDRSHKEKSIQVCPTNGLLRPVHHPPQRTDSRRWHPHIPSLPQRLLLLLHHPPQRTDIHPSHH
jgi:hypothetical protein